MLCKWFDIYEVIKFQFFVEFNINSNMTATINVQSQYIAN